jgi:hypothetical protein
MTPENSTDHRLYWTQKNYWPFATLPVDQETDEYQRERSFLEAAYCEGYRPYMDGIGNLGATSSEREAWILVRGRSRWEMRLWRSEPEVLQEALSVQLDSFDAAAAAALLWLRGHDPSEVESMVRDHVAVQHAVGRIAIPHAESVSQVAR